MQGLLADGLRDTAAAGTVPKSRRRRVLARDTPRAPWAERLIGKAIGDSHRIVRDLSGGGFGHVFVAEHVRTGRLAAVKLSVPGSTLAARILADEADVLASVFHPNIVRMRDHGGVEGDSAYLIMDYAAGIELETWLEEHGPMPPARVLAILSQLAAAVDYLHQRGVVHADLKPTHLIIDESANDELTLLDFGCAFDPSDPIRSREVGGTPGYMPPEQTCGGRCTKAVDIYAMAALATELLTGQLPHPQTTRTVMRAVMTQPPELPSARGLVRPGLDAVFARALHRNAAARFESATEFVSAMRVCF
jgi:serine/threonine-protein kinase